MLLAIFLIAVGYTLWGGWGVIFALLALIFFGQ